jgi:hypothetical protein
MPRGGIAGLEEQREELQTAEDSSNQTSAPGGTGVNAAGWFNSVRKLEFPPSIEFLWFRLYNQRLRLAHLFQVVVVPAAPLTASVVQLRILLVMCLFSLQIAIRIPSALNGIAGAI